MSVTPSITSQSGISSNVSMNETNDWIALPTPARARSARR